MNTRQEIREQIDGIKARMRYHQKALNDLAKEGLELNRKTLIQSGMTFAPQRGKCKAA